jgi:dihydropteroate synthase
VARAAIEAGASIINDVAAHRTATEMWDVVRETGAAYVLMHAKGTPQSMQGLAEYADVTGEVSAFFAAQLEHLARAGVELERVVLDPGIGFAKKMEHNLELLGCLSDFRKYQRPLLVGASRKGFIGQVTGAELVADRLGGSLACACAAVEAGASIVRAHDVAATRQALRMTEAIAAKRKL